LWVKEDGAAIAGNNDSPGSHRLPVQHESGSNLKSTAMPSSSVCRIADKPTNKKMLGT
jgi:hypothetical protein